MLDYHFFNIGWCGNVFFRPAIRLFCFEVGGRLALASEFIQGSANGAVALEISDCMPDDTTVKLLRVLLPLESVGMAEALLLLRDAHLRVSTARVPVRVLSLKLFQCSLLREMLDQSLMLTDWAWLHHLKVVVVSEFYVQVLLDRRVRFLG
mmetsp:Transcript_43859/g.58145  ORF Transcript_43859/g.58145 Transcript_43859/m.58145 type:complete len:151 (+) Transcript_43859:1103-1555(+)